MAKTLWNLFWYFPEARYVPATSNVSLNSAQKKTWNTIAKNDLGIPAAIVYPALLTPGVVVKTGGRKVELIIATKKSYTTDKLRARVSNQLKVSQGLDPYLSHSLAALLAGDPLINQKILIGPEQDLKPGKILTTKIDDNTPYHFRGTLDSKATDVYRDDMGLKKAYAVHIDAAILAPPVNPERAMIQADGRIRLPAKFRAKYHQDYAFGRKLGVKKLGEDFHYGLYGFEVAGGDTRVGTVDPNNPLLIFHPVFAYDAGDISYFNVGHMADIHVCSRQQILKKSKARVIEAGDTSPAPKVGDVINVSSARVKAMLDKFGAGPQSVDVVVIGGDLIDFVPQNIVRNLHATPLSVKSIWDKVTLDFLDSNWKEDFLNNVDYIAVYSLLTRFYRDAGARPAFAVTGNHDYYAEPFGIAPTAPGGMRTNEAIAGDHNMTYYEAILSFGDTYHRLAKNTGSPFDGDARQWFYRLFTPWTDFNVELPNQHLLALAWGDEEEMVRGRGQGIGHLPRANKALSDEQLKLVKQVTDNRGGKKIVLTSHFTFVSYKEAISNTTAIAPPNNGVVKSKIGIHNVLDWSPFGDYDQGTFHHKREEMYNDLILPGGIIQIVLTGHSHRRGLYWLTRGDGDGVRTTGRDYARLADYPAGTALPGFAAAPADHSKTMILLSDSGGPNPMLNWNDEFRGWGRGPSAGTRIAFDAAGNIQAITPVVVKAADNYDLPRFVVCLDYIDILQPKAGGNKIGPIIQSFQADRVRTDGTAPQGNKYAFQVALNAEITNARYGVRIDWIRLYYAGFRGNGSRAGRARIDLASGGGRYTVPANRRAIFDRYFVGNKKRETFCAIKFSPVVNSPLAGRYDFNDPWTFEVTVKKDTSGIFRREMQYIIERDSDHAEVPDFDRRAKYGIYQTP